MKKEISKNVRAQGDVFDVTSRTEDVTLPFALRVTQVQGPYNELDRKLFAFLVHAAHEELETKRTHRVKASEVTRVFQHLSGSKDRGWLWKSAKSLAQTTIEWVSTEKDGSISKHVTPLFSYASTKKEERADGFLEYEFPKRLIPFLVAPFRYGRIRTHFLLSLSGKYSVTLYQILECFTRDGVLTASLEELRTWLQIPENSLNDTKDFRKRALEPAIKQINTHSNESGFTVELSPVKSGRKITGFRFLMQKTNVRQIEEAKMKRVKPKFRGHSSRFRTTVYEQARQVAPGLDIYELEIQFNEFCEYLGEEPKNPAAAFIGFCKKKHKDSK